MSRRLLAAGLLASLVLGPAACAADEHQAAPRSTAPAAQEQGADAVVRSLGAVPVPRPTADAAPVPATPAHPQLVAMGYPVRVKARSAEAVLLARGPAQRTTSLPAGGARRSREPSTVGTISVRMAVLRGGPALRAADFTARDQSGHTIGLHAVASQQRARPASPARSAGSGSVSAPGSGFGSGSAGRTLLLRGRFASGSAQLTWRLGGHSLATWVFTVELD